jgi:hypothetical protein
VPRINIADFCGAAHVSRGDGAHLRSAIEQSWDAPEPLVLDFSNIRIASVSFFDESFGLLAREHPLDELTRRVRVENMDPSDRALLNRIVQSRARERTNARKAG